jgi:hypothetical protein
LLKAKNEIIAAKEEIIAGLKKENDKLRKGAV